MQNCGNTDAKFSTGKQIKRRKSRVHAIDIPTGMQRNLSESQLMQVGSKAVSNVAEQFSKLGQTLNPKILTGKKANDQDDSAAIEQSENENKEEEENSSNHTVADSIDLNSLDNDPSEAGNVFNDNSFLQSVGIVMVDAGELAATKNPPEIRKNKKLLNNVSRISISSVTDNVNMPQEMLDIVDSPDKLNTATTPAISVHETDDGTILPKNDGMKMCHSVNDMRIDTDLSDDKSRYYFSYNFNFQRIK